MQRLTSEITAETTVSIVPIPSDDLKGRIIGREGRNIRAFEAATGCDLIIDDTPEIVTVSGFDPVRREIARVALSRLIQDGRIQPTRIEEAVDRARGEVDQTIVAAGEEALTHTEVTGLPQEVVNTLGRLRYRFSYGQNQLRHSIETSWLAAAVAHEIGADVEVARTGGLLHDLGKAVDREVEGTHAAVGADIARRLGVPREVVHCIEAHHEEVTPETTEALVVIIADAMSGSRPRRPTRIGGTVRQAAGGAGGESPTRSTGVDKSFAIQAGREVRIIVQPEAVDDADAHATGARRLEEDRGHAPVPGGDQGHGGARNAGLGGGSLAMRLLMVGDVVGRPGRAAVAQLLPELRSELALDGVVLNGENAAHGRGLTEKTARELFDAGVDVITSGNHIFNVRRLRACPRRPPADPAARQLPAGSAGPGHVHGRRPDRHQPHGPRVHADAGGRPVPDGGDAPSPACPRTRPSSSISTPRPPARSRR